MLSGGTRREDLDRYAYQPDMIVDSIDELDHGGLLERFTTATAAHRNQVDDHAFHAFAQAAGPG